MKRRYDIDWLRVIAILLVLYFHVAMIFATEWGWHIKNGELSSLWLEFNFWLSRFRMPLLFFISGFGTFLALRKRTNWQYVKERYNRLMIPLIFSIFVIVPPQIYLERIFNDPDSYASFFSFYPETFKFQPYPAGNTSWHHMWFVLYLFFYSVVGLPLFLWMRRERSKQFLSNVFNGDRFWKVVLLVVPSLFVYLFVYYGKGQTNDFINDWPAHAYWFTFFFIGYLVGCVPSLWEAIEKNRRTFLGLALLAIVTINYFRWNNLEPWTWVTVSPFWEYLAVSLLPLDSWMWILAALGYAKHYLNKPSPILSYMNQAIYPIYILHQTVIIILGFYIIRVEESILSKYLLISSLSVVFTLAIYEYLVRPFRITRFLFGVKEPKTVRRRVPGQIAPADAVKAGSSNGETEKLHVP